MFFGAVTGAASGGVDTLLTSLVAYFPLSDLNDSVGGHTLTNSSPANITFTSGKNGSAATWANSVTHMLSASDATALRFGNANWTVSCWVNFTRVGTTNSDTVLAKSNLFVTREVIISRFQNRLDAEIFNGTTTSIQQIQFSSAIPSNGWYFVCLRNVASTKTLTLVVNDSGKSATYTGTPGTGASVFSIGAQNVNGNAQTAMTGGQIDEVAKWNRALTDDEILLLYNGGTGTFGPFVGTETPIAWTAPRILYGNGIGNSASTAKGTATVGTHNNQGTLLSPARKIVAKWANSTQNFGGGNPSGENNNVITNSFALRASMYAEGQSAATVLTLDDATLSVGEIATSADARVSAFKSQICNIRTEVTAGASDLWPGNSQSNSTARWNVFGNTSAITAATSYAPGTDGQFHFGPAVVLGEIPINAATGRNRNTCAIRGDSISPYLQTICLNEAIPHLYLGLPGEAITDLTRTRADETRTPLTRLAHVVVDQYGVNDIRSSRTSAQLQADKAAMWAAWVAGGCDRIVTVTITPLPAFSTTERNSYNTWLKGLDSAAVSALVGKTVSYTCIDVCPAVEVSAGSNTWVSGTTDDNVHPNATGVAAILSAYQTAIADAISAAIS